MLLLVEIRKDRTAISQQLAQCAHELEGCCKLLQQTLQYTQEFQTALPLPTLWHKIYLASWNRGIATAAAMVVASPLVPYTTGVFRVAIGIAVWIVVSKCIPNIHHDDYHPTTETCNRNKSELENEIHLITDMKEIFQRISKEQAHLKS